tara:strand:+ start:8205 stop:9434 length:1230 start_codon:yes stop_codon:yes gene_type:complete
MSSLQEIGLKHKTDKAHTHFYMRNYEVYLESWRDKEFVLLEIGVAGGASIAAWREYFPKAKVYGIDINPDCAGYVDGVFIGSQNDSEFMDRVLASTGTIDIVVDDGSHEGWRTIDTFKYLFPKIASGGLYFVEDTATFYNNHYSGEFQSNGRTEVFNFFTGLAYDVDVAGRGMCGNRYFAINHPTSDPPVPEYSRILESIHIHTGLWLFKRLSSVKELMVDGNLTMLSGECIDNIFELIEKTKDIPGDFLETGIWKGGACIIARTALSPEKTVYCADSFQGLPPMTHEKDIIDYTTPNWDYIKVPLEDVKNNFKEFGMTEGVEFIEGWFSESLKGWNKPLSILRLDGDMYSSTMDALEHCYFSVSKGGYVIVDDYFIPECAMAIKDFMEKYNLNNELIRINYTSVYWQV